MEQLIAKVFAENCGPGKPLEIGADSWNCGGKTVNGKGFVAGPSTLRQYYQTFFQIHADKEFVIFQGERYTFKQIEEKCLQLINVLQTKYKIQRGDRVAVCMRNYPEWIISFLAITYLGAVVVPLNSYWKTHELDYGIRDSGSTVIICDGDVFKRIFPLNKKLFAEVKLQMILARHSVAKSLYSRLPNIDDLESLMAEAKPLNVETEDVQTEDIAAIMYTSGTTGFPKGVVLTHKGVTSQLRMLWMLTKVTAGLAAASGAGAPTDQPCAICPVPLFHVTASHHVFLAALTVGRKTVLMYKWDAATALKLIEKERPQSWASVPTMVQDMINHPDFEKTDTSSLKAIGVGGSSTVASLVKNIATKLSAAPAQAYGLTETNGGVANIIGPDYLNNPGSTGRPYPIVEICVVGSDDASKTGELKSLGANVPGELAIKGPQVMREYWNKPEETAKAIVSISGKGPGWFRTGDIGKVDDRGYVYILDRTKDIIIRGGENISCAEIESALSDYPGTIESAVVGIVDERLGEDVGCVIVLNEEARAKSEDTVKDEIIALLKGKLAAFKVPKPENIFLQAERLPKGDTGKILKRVVKDQVNEKKNASNTENQEA